MRKIIRCLSFAQAVAAPNQTWFLAAADGEASTPTDNMSRMAAITASAGHLPQGGSCLAISFDRLAAHPGAPAAVAAVT